MTPDTIDFDMISVMERLIEKDYKKLLLTLSIIIDSSGVEDERIKLLKAFIENEIILN